MEQQNVTVSLPADLLREARHLAVDQGVSLSRFIAHLVEAEIEGRRQYRVAKDRQVALLREGLPLDTYGQIDWDRSDLHER